MVEDRHRARVVVAGTDGLAPFPGPEFRVHMDAMANKIGFPLQAVAQ